MASDSAKQDQTLTNTQSSPTMHGGKQSEPVDVVFKRTCGTNSLSLPVMDQWRLTYR